MLPLLLVVLSAAPARVAITGLEVSGVKEPARGFFASRLGQALEEHHVAVITSDEVAALLGIERQRQLLGCEQSQCTAELAGALGVDLVLLGHIARLESVVQVDLKVIAAGNGAHRASFSRRVSKDEEVLRALDDAAASISADLAGDGAQGSRGWAFVPVGIGGLACAGVGAAFLVDALTVHAQLTGEVALSAGPDVLVARGKQSQLVGLSLVGVGGAALVAAAVLLLLPASSAPVALVPAPSGVAVVGVFP